MRQTGRPGACAPPGFEVSLKMDLTLDCTVCTLKSILSGRHLLEQVRRVTRRELFILGHPELPPHPITGASTDLRQITSPQTSRDITTELWP